MIENERTPGFVAIYNDMQLKVLRIGSSWDITNNALRSGDLKRLKFELDIIWNELSPLVYKNNYKKILEKNEKIEKSIRGATKDNSKLNTLLNLRCRFLKYVQDKVGLGTKTRKDEEDDDGIDY